MRIHLYISLVSFKDVLIPTQSAKNNFSEKPTHHATFSQKKVSFRKEHAHRIHVWYIYTYIYHTKQPNVIWVNIHQIYQSHGWYVITHTDRSNLPPPKSCHISCCRWWPAPYSSRRDWKRSSMPQNVAKISELSFATLIWDCFFVNNPWI